MLKISVEITNEDLNYVENFCDINRLTFEEFFHQCVELHKRDREDFKSIGDIMGVIPAMQSRLRNSIPSATKPEISPVSTTKNKGKTK